MSHSARRRQAHGQPWTPESERTYTENIIRRAKAGSRPVLREFAAWLERERGAALSTITVRIGSMRSFVEATTPARGAWTGERVQLTAQSLEDFFISYARKHGMAARRSMRSAVRGFLQFAACRGWVEPDLKEAVPSLRTYRLSALPRGFDDDAVGQMLQVDDRVSTRDRAILSLLACYGVRRGQVAALDLDDLGWRNRIIRFAAHKGGKPVCHTLVPAVAEPLARYLHDERPATQSRRVFLRSRAPYLPLSPKAISGLVMYRALKLGLVWPCGPHAFRHAFATRLLRSGQPLKSIADLLGHRGLDAVGVYAKLNHPALLEVAVDWPEERP